MRLSRENIKKLCNNRKLSLRELLSQAGVSKTAYYALLDKESVLPRSIDRLAETLGVAPAKLLEEKDPEVAHHEHRISRLNAIMKKYPDADRDQVWHTLVALDEDPWTRLDRGLLRGQKFNFHGKRG